MRRLPRKGFESPWACLCAWGRSTADITGWRAMSLIGRTSMKAESTGFPEMSSRASKLGVTMRLSVW